MLAIALIAIASLAAVNAQTCSQAAQFSSCISRSAKQSAGCSAAVKSVPDLTYWNCVCDSYRARLACYSFCTDDSQLQDQLSSLKAEEFSSCQYADEQRKNGVTVPSPAPKSTSPKSATPSAPAASAKNETTTDSKSGKSRFNINVDSGASFSLMEKTAGQLLALAAIICAMM